MAEAGKPEPIVAVCAIAHIADNIDIFGFELTEDEMAQVAALDRGKSYFNWPEWFERIMYKFSGKTPFGERG